jgi:dTDP-glucose pyrophosphorylase
MDTTTVLEIIKMIDRQLIGIQKDYKHDNKPADKSYWLNVGKEQSLVSLQSYLQSFIEAQLNAAENNLGSSE